MATVDERRAEVDRRIKNVRLSDEAHRRLKLNAARLQIGQSELANELIMTHLPDVQVVATRPARAS